MAQNFKELANFIWSVADLLRGDYKQAEYGEVVKDWMMWKVYKRINKS